MKAAAIGINGLSFSAIADCNPIFLTNLFGSSPRGVIENRSYYEPAKAWKVILRDMSFEELASKGVVLSNIPLLNPTYGKPSLDIAKVGLTEELDLMIKTINDYADKYIVVYSINTYEREIGKNREPCEVLKVLDRFLQKAFENLDSYMFFSPYGFYEKKYEPFGIYLSSVPRPEEEETIKLEQLLDLIFMLK